MKLEKLKHFWEDAARPTFPLSRDSRYGQLVCNAFDEAITEAQAAGLTGHEDEFSLKWAQAAAGARIELTAEVLGVSLGKLSDLIGASGETISCILTGKHAPSYRLEQALYRELLHFAIIEWVENWEIPAARAEFEAAYLANRIDFGGYVIEADPDHGFPDDEPVPGLPITDKFGRAIYALGAVCGKDGWRDFWKEVGCHLYPITPYESSAQYFKQRLKEAKKQAGKTVETAGEQA